jgi:hypothetical protein
VTHDWREPFERALDDDPSDQRVRRDLADHLEERGDRDAEPVRWLADRRRSPLRVGWGRPRPWEFWSADGGREVRAPRHCHVPAAVAARMAGTAPNLRDYPTRREAEADFCRAFHLAKAAGWGPLQA